MPFKPKVCFSCGRILDDYETCHCQMKISGIKEKQKPNCPYYKFRSGYKGRSYIGCGEQKHEYIERGKRDFDLWAYCYGDYEDCEFYREHLAYDEAHRMKGE